MLDRLIKFIADPVGIIVALAIAAVVAGLVLVGIRIYSRRLSSGETTVEEPPLLTARPEEAPATPVITQPEGARAKLLLPNGMEISVRADGQSIGRADLARALSLDCLALISQKQFQVSYNEGDYFIEDTGSTNGTTLNGIDIKGKGQFVLKDGDIVSAAGTANIDILISRD